MLKWDCPIMPNLVRSIDNDCAYKMLLKLIDADHLVYPWGWPKLIDFVDDDPLFKLMEPFGLFCPSQLGLSFFFLHFLLEEDASCCFWVSVQSKIVSVKKIIEDVDTWKIEGTEFHIQSIFQKFKNIRNWVFVLLTPWDVNMPQQGFDDVERAYISFLQLISLAEPSSSLTQAYGFYYCMGNHKPAKTCCCLLNSWLHERDIL